MKRWPALRTNLWETSRNLMPRSAEAQTNLGDCAVVALTALWPT